ncbi:hypothetical protein, partial [Chryseobacterium sp. Alg-005]|uniref:hypothetical protein n=1 Tax=Chryseobacterium sp. Alg-005 TaxID=3159516 RepID=UPI0036F3C457
DGATKFAGVTLTFTSTPAAYTGQTSFLRANRNYSNSTNAAVIGNFDAAASRTLYLPSGTYVFDAVALINHEGTSEGLRCRFGLNTFDILDVIVH